MEGGLVDEPLPPFPESPRPASAVRQRRSLGHEGRRIRGHLVCAEAGSRAPADHEGVVTGAVVRIGRRPGDEREVMIEDLGEDGCRRPLSRSPNIINC